MAETQAPFGRPMRDAHFSFASSYVPLNHGSFGAFPDIVRDHQRDLQSETEARPDTFIRFTYPERLLEARQAAAPLLGADVEEVVFVPNCLTGINTVLRNLVYVEGDVILHFSTIYGGCLKTVRSLEETTPVHGYSIDLTYPIEDDAILHKVEAALEAVKREGRRVVLAMFDTVLTFPGVRLPWESLVQLYRHHGILSCIDAAHGVGNIDLTHLAKVGPDFVVTNCYKWLMVPRGCAVLYVPRRNQHLLKTSYPTDGRYLPREDRDDVPPARYFSNQFEHVSTIDTSPYLCVPAALRFRNEVCGGEERVREYCIKLAQDGGKLMAKLMGTEVLSSSSSLSSQTTAGNAQWQQQQCCFTNVKLPLNINQGNETAAASHGIPPEDADTVAIWMTETSVREFDTYIAVRSYAGAFWTRISAQIYLDLGDFAWAAGVLLELCARAQRGHYRKPISDRGAASVSASWLEYR